MDDEALEAVIVSAKADKVGLECRQRTCQALAASFREVGQALWVGGYIIGPDRAAGQSPFGFGSDATVGLATVVQVAGELTAGAAGLLEQDNLYAAAALTRQLVEVEYLAWTFSEDHEQAMTWLRSTREERRKFWQPRDLRQRSGGRFRATDYQGHCDRGGHPTPDALTLLPDHRRRVPVAWWWLDLTLHGVSVWEYTEAAVDVLDWGDQARAIARNHRLPEAIERWRREDSLAPAALGTINENDR